GAVGEGVGAPAPGDQFVDRVVRRRLLAHVAPSRPGGRLEKARRWLWASSRNGTDSPALSPRGGQVFGLFRLNRSRYAFTMNPIYPAYNATTPIDPAVLEAILPFLQRDFGNPSSTHAYGKAAHDAVEQARREVADLLGAAPDEIVFTGGGSEASNQAI